jgi:hypothetical protein
MTVTVNVPASSGGAPVVIVQPGSGSGQAPSVDIPTSVGPAGVGVPTGGSTGQVLAKASAANYDTAWVDQSGGGSSPPFAISDITGLQSALNAKQALDGDLTALSALTGTNTLYYRSADSVWSPVVIGANLTFSGGTLAATGGGGGVSPPFAISDTTGLQTALDGKQPLDGDLTSIAALTTTTFGRNQLTYADAAAAKTALSLVKGDVGLANVDNTSDANKPVSSAQQTALNLKANLASPTFTGTVGGITPAMVGLGNVTNTSDANKPVSTAQQAALDLKANLASPTFTGTVSGISKGMVGLGNVDNTSDAAKPVSTAQQAALDLKANLASPSLTGTPTAPTAANGTNTTQLATTAFVLANAGGGGSENPAIRQSIGNVLPAVTGRWYDGSFHGAATATLTGIANRIDLAPFFCGQTIVCDQIAVTITTIAASTFVKIVVYSANTDGTPANLIFESADLDAGTTGGREVALSYTFTAGTLYWLGVRYSGAPAVRAIPLTSALSLGASSSNVTSYLTILRKTRTFATAAESVWTYSAAEATTGAPPAIRLRSA